LKEFSSFDPRCRWRQVTGGAGEFLTAAAGNRITL
jgi:hypothetical protein